MPSLNDAIWRAGKSLSLFSGRRSNSLHEAGVANSEAGDDAAAIANYHQALALKPNRPDTLYNLGLLAKYRGDWQAAFDFNERANRARPNDEATLWNLAIAATALRHWTAARAAWTTLGIDVPPGTGPITDDRGHVPVRLNAGGGTEAPVEVVWSAALCPVRSRVLNIPTGATGFRHGDVVLHDGAPVGYRSTPDGLERPVFNVLALFEPSLFSTYEVSAETDGPEDIEALETLCETGRVRMADWTASLRTLCKACSEGRPHEGHDHRRVGLAAENDDVVEAVLTRWNSRPVRINQWRCTLNARATAQ